MLTKFFDDEDEDNKLTPIVNYGLDCIDNSSKAIYCGIEEIPGLYFVDLVHSLNITLSAQNDGVIISQLRGMGIKSSLKEISRIVLNNR